MQQLLNTPVTRHALNAWLTPFYFLFQSKKLLLRLVMLVMSVGMMSGVVGQATVTSDKDDYAPRSNAVFTGSGFAPGETVTLKVKNLSRPCNTIAPDSSYLPWTVVADASGAFVTNWTVCDCNGDSLRLKATGMTSGLFAYAYFTDANPNSLSIAQTSLTVTAGNSVSSNITINSVGNSSGCTITLSTNLPADATISISGGNPFTINGTSTKLMTINTLSTLAPGIYNYTLTAERGVDCQGSGNLTTTGTLTVKAPTSLSEVSGSGIYGGTVTLTATLNPNLSGQSVSFSLGSSTWNANTNASGIATVLVPFTSIPAAFKNAGTYTNGVGVSFAGNTNYSASSASGNLTIGKATPAVTVTGYNVTYDGQPHTATYSISGVNGESGATVGTINVSATTHTNAGTYNNDAWIFTGAANYNDANGTVNNVISKAPSATTVTINGGPFTYTGSAITPATVSVTGAGGLNLTPSAVYANNVNAGTATASYNYAGDANHEASSDSKNFAIDKANATVSVSGYTGVYDGNAHGATGTATGVNGESLSGLDLGASFINVPGGTANWTFTDVTGNYNNTSGSVEIIISKAPSVTTVTINGGPFTYTGSAITPATVSVTGAGWLNLTPTANYSNNVNAGTATASYSYLGDANHEPSSDSKNFTIGKANATVSVNGYTGVYDGNAHGATGTATGVNGESLSGLDLGASFINVPGGIANWKFTDVTGNYNNTSGSVEIIISKAPSVTTVTINGGPFTYTGSAITPATVSVTGAGGLNLTPTAVYTNNINAGTATASYNYAGDANHEASSDSKNFTIDKANATVNVSGYTGVYDGNAHGATGTATGVNGESLSGLDLGASFTNVPGGTANWTFTDVTGNYNNTNGSVQIVIGKANATVNVSGYTGVYDGNAHGATGTATGVNGESLSGLDLGSSFTNVPGGTANWTFTDVTGNYNGASGSVQIVISKAPSVTTVTINGGPFTYTGSAITPATVTVTGAGWLNLTPTANYSNNVNAGTATASYSYPGDENHEPSSDSKNFTIDKANATVSVSGYTGVYDGDAHGATGTATGVNGESLSGLDLGASFTNVPGGTANWTFTDVTGNYNGASGSVQISISTKSASVTPNASSKYCGQADPVFTGTLSGFLAVDNVTATYTRTAGETVLGSPYTISATLAGVLSNYNITYNTAGFTINGVAIDASGSSATVPIGQTARLKAVVTDGTTGVAGVAVKFEIKNSTGTIIQTKNTSSGAGGVIDIAADALTLGVYQVVATAGDGCGTSTAYITMYDANENFVTGGGWINSPAGALTADPTVVGKANFGFVSKYKKGSSQVDGNTEFQFNAGNINFKSTMHESGSLVISGGKATYRGSGTVNGNTGYKFVIVAMDGNWNNGFNPDRFRIKITTTNGQTVYDNQMNSAENADDATNLGGGSIVIHETKKKTSNRMDPGTLILTPQEFGVKVFGNPSLSSFRLQMQSSDLFTKFTVKVVDVNGRLMEVKENLYAGQVIELGAAYKQGVYFAEVTQGASRKVVQLVKAGKE